MGKKKEPVKTLSNIILEELIVIWGKAALPSIRKDKIFKKIIDLIAEFENFMKNWSRHDEDKVDNYRQSLLSLFDIAPTDIEEKLRMSYKTNTEWQEDLTFYRCQSAVPQVGSLGARDQVLEKRLKEKGEREEKHLKKKQKHELECKNVNTKKCLLDDVEVHLEEDEHEDKEYTPSKKVMIKEKCKTKIIEDTSPIAIRHGLSTRAHLAIVAGTVKSMGGDIDTMPASISSLHRKRKKACKSLADDVCCKFNDKWKGWPKIIQWDGKMMEVMQEDSGAKKEDINVVAFNVPGSEEKVKTIAIPSVKQATGAVLAEMIVEKGESGQN